MKYRCCNLIGLHNNNDNDNNNNNDVSSSRYDDDSINSNYKSSSSSNRSGSNNKSNNNEENCNKSKNEIFNATWQTQTFWQFRCSPGVGPFATSRRSWVQIQQQPILFSFTFKLICFAPEHYHKEFDKNKIENGWQLRCLAC